MPSSLIDPGKTKSGAYSAPKLTVYGEAKTLTASGTGTATENGNQPNCSGHIDRRPC